MNYNDTQAYNACNNLSGRPFDAAAINRQEGLRVTNFGGYPCMTFEFTDGSWIEVLTDEDDGNEEMIVTGYTSEGHRFDGAGITDWGEDDE